LAEQWMGQADVPVDDPMGERELWSVRCVLRRVSAIGWASSGATRLDPIEDFIVNDPRGHCEYFAGLGADAPQPRPAFARGRRVQDRRIQPARRAVLGPAVACSRLGRGLHPPEFLPDAVRDRHPLFDWSHGGWLRLDPTPSSLERAGLAEYLKQKWRDWRAAVATMWMQHVMQMSGTQQDSLIYRPLLATLQETAARLRDGGIWNRRSADEFSGSPWQLLMLTLPWVLGGTLALAALAWWTFGHRRSAAAFRKSAGGSKHRWSGNGRAGTSVEFYRSWEALWQQWGLDRPACQTPREFARQHGGRLAELAGQPQLRDAANCVIDAFYQVRFGGATLDERQTAQVEDALDRLRQATRQTAKAAEAP
jgi:protein-glutamine gamma-glutamyltransferase